MRILTAIVVFMCATPAAAQPGPALTWQAITYKHAGGEEPAEQAMLDVPERHAAPAGKFIQLAVVRFRSRSPNPSAPIIYLAGGPGSSGIEAGRGPRFALFDALRAHGDVILLDQRGAGHSRPNLNCSERWSLDPAGQRSWASMTAIAAERVRPCVARLREQGVDLAAFNTRESADDVDWLRRALRAPQVNLIAISYGTHLGLAVLARHGATIERVVLAGVVGPDHVLKLPSNIDRIVEAFGKHVAADPVFGAQPPFAATLRGIISRLEAEPARVTLARNGQSIPVTVSAFDVRIVVSLALEDRETMRNLPLLVYAMARGEFRPIAEQLTGLARMPIPTAMNLAVECASGATAARRARIQRETSAALIGRVIDLPQPDICEYLGAGDLGDAFRRPVQWNGAALLISGDLDLRTPPSNADEVIAGGMTGASHLVLERAGHDDDLLVGSAQLPKVIASFIGGEAATVNRITLPPIPFSYPPR